MASPLSFFQNVGTFFKNNILEVFQDFFQNGKINKRTNETYIAIIAKKEWSLVVVDYRPTSLTTSLYKIIAKTLFTRLKAILPNTISDNEMASVHGRQTTDAILIANEAIDLWKRNKTRGFVIKIDLEKAFDKINCNFIQFMLKNKNFS